MAMEFKVLDLGLTDYKESYRLQEETFENVRRGTLESALMLCQHNPVITMGRAAKSSNILIGPEELKKQGIMTYKIERGGDVTYHGPGQLTAYPVFNLNHWKKDIHFFLRQLEAAIMGLLDKFGIKSQTRSGLTGVWVEQKKIASIGISIRNWITFHGLSINITDNDLDNFRLIRPCGMDIEMTSLETILGKSIEINTVKKHLISQLRGTFL